MGGTVVTVNEVRSLPSEFAAGSLSDVATGQPCDAVEDTMWAKAQQQVNAISLMEAGWDGDGAPVISDFICRSSGLLLRTLRKQGSVAPNDIYPTPDAHIIVEWQLPDDVIVRIEVDGLWEGEKMVSYPSAPSEFERITWRPLRVRIQYTTDGVRENPYCLTPNSVDVVRRVSHNQHKSRKSSDEFQLAA